MISNIRKQYPQYDDLSDQELVDAFYSKYYSDISKDEFYNKIGYTAEPKNKGEGFLNNITTGAANIAKGIPTGLGNALVGGVQAFTDLGEGAARAVEKKVYGDVLGQETFGKRLTKQAAARKAKQSNLPTGEQIGIAVGETLPYGGIGKGAGLVKQGAMVGGVSSSLGMKGEEGLTNRGKEAARDAAIGAGGSFVLGKTLNAAGGQLEKVSNKIKNIFTKGNAPAKVTDVDDAASILSKNIPKKELAEGISQLEEGASNLVGLDIDSPKFANMYKTALSKFPDSKEIANDFAKGRLEKGYDRISKSLNKISLEKSGRKNIEDLMTERKVITSPLYDAVRENPTKIPQFTYKTIKTTELPATTKFTNQAKTSGVRKDLITDLESTEQYIKGGKDISKYTEKGVIKEGDKFLQSQKEIGSFTGGTTKGDTITKIKSKIVQEGDKNIKIDRKITNFKDLSTKEKQIARQFEEIKDNPVYSKLLKKSQSDFSLEEGVNDTKDLLILKEKYNQYYDTFSSSELGYVKSLKDNIDDLLVKLSPEAKQADKIYSNYSKVISAGEKGLNFNSLNKTQVAEEIKDLGKKQLEAYRASAKEALLESVEKNIKTAGANKPAEAIFNSDYDKLKIKALFKDNKAGYDAFKKEMVDEIQFNKTLQKYGLTNADVLNDNNLMANVAGRTLAFGAGGGKTGALFETGRFIQKLAMRRYKGLNKKTANSLAKAMTNKENSLKALKKAYNNVKDTEQKRIFEQIVEEISPVLTATTIKTITE
jgi:hypothetical protein